ncbi:MAG: hypothetical protein WBB43_06700 [Limnoraphis sp.]
MIYRPIHTEAICQQSPINVIPIPNNKIQSPASIRACCKSSENPNRLDQEFR